MRTRIAFIFLLCLLVASSVSAQVIASEVYVTTQDFVALRAGPSKRFERTAVIAPATTLRAVGRTANMSWVQVEHDDGHGWIAARLLVWSGDIVSLPVDGIDPDPFIRRALVSAVTFRDTPMYRRYLIGSDRIGTIPPEVELEVTGRLGEQGFFWVQVNYDGQLVWVGSWDLHVIAGSYASVLDTGYLYPYGRLNDELAGDAANSLGTLTEVESIWVQLGSGHGVSCTPLPDYVVRRAVDNDIAREPIFAPVVAALDDANSAINGTLSAFADACAGEARVVTQQDVNNALASLAGARRDITLALALLNSLDNRDPILNNDSSS